MANRQDRKGRSKGGPAFVQLFHWIRKTDAWRSLSPFARLLYIEIRARYSGSNNGDIPMSYREAEELLNCSNKPIPTAFRELQDRGFIVPVQKGAFSWKVRFQGAGRATTWRLTELPADYPERSLSPSYDFKAWKPDPENKTRHAKSGPDARQKRAISDDMARQKRANGTLKAGHNGQNAVQHGTPKAGTIRSTIFPAPIGDVSRALLKSKIIVNASAAASGEEFD
jgi:hypothetical protein